LTIRTFFCGFLQNPECFCEEKYGDLASNAVKTSVKTGKIDFNRNPDFAKSKTAGGTLFPHKVPP